LELRELWTVVRRRIWLVAGVTAAALLFSFVFAFASGQSYKSTVKIAIKPQLEARGSYYSYDEYYSYVASEYLIDDVVEIIRSKAFLKEVNALLGKQDNDPDVSPIDARKSHRVLTITAVGVSANDAIDMARASVDVLLNMNYFDRLSQQKPGVSVVDGPHVTTSAGRQLLDVALRTLLGLLAGIGLVFLLEYLDNTLRGRQDAERILGLAVLGEIPLERRGR